MISAIATTVIVPPLLALLVSSAVIAVMIHTRVATFVLDRPNPRSLHATPTPRLGGIGIVAGTGAAWAWTSLPIDPRLLAALGLLACISLLDDLKSVSVAWRLTIHLASAALATTAVLQGNEPWLLPVAILATAWMINLYNFMDGSDGLAGGMAVIGFGSYGMATLAGGNFADAATCLSVAAAALGFLLFNFPPAKIFMGDIGAIPLGCLAAVFDLAGWLRGDWPIWFGIVVFSPFIVDASYTLLKRLLHGAKVWQPHREHFYQRLVQSGWGHRKTALAEYALMLLCSGIALACLHQGRALQLTALSTLALLYAWLIVVLERHLDRHA
ncbi:MAG: glycosyltransferase family 4 protein [Sulfuricaulis sp.]|nr:glycosyltransferase family 4 protein [Sulfuricaulis sp.]